MASTRTYQRTFIGGEISPVMWGRVDDPKYQNGVATMRNWIAMPQGSARRRPGTRFVREVANSSRKTRLIPFTFGTAQSYALEVCGAIGTSFADLGRIRIHIDGGTVTRPLASSALAPNRRASATVTFTQSGNDLLVNWTAHPFTASGVDRVCFSLPGGWQAAHPVQAGRYYLFTPVGANSFKLSFPGSPTTRVPWLAGVAGTITGHAYYGPGDFVTDGGDVYYCRAAVLFGQATSTLANWFQQATTFLEIPHEYQQDQLRDMKVAQSNDILTVTTPNLAPHELRRLGAQSWSFVKLLFSDQVVSPPAGLATSSAADSYGKLLRLDNLDSSVNDAAGLKQVIYRTVDQTPAGSWVDIPHGFAKYDLARVIHLAPASYNAALHLAAGVYQIENNNLGSPDTANPSRFTLIRLDGSRVDDPFTSSAVTTNEALYDSGPNHRVMYTDSAEATTNSYVVTSVSASGAESKASAAVTSSIPLENVGAFNLLTWSPQYGGELVDSFGSVPTEPAASYRIYKEQNGIYGYIGKAAQGTAPSFKDDNIGPDMSATPPISDTSLQSQTDFPRCVTYFEQRRVFASTTLKPQDVWMTNAGTEADLTYHIPSLDSDRIYFRIAARTGGVIQHMVPLGHLVLLGSDTEWRVTPLNDDKVTPSSISVRPQSYIGANNATPQLINNVCLYAAARGGHIRELGWSSNSASYVTGDVSLRATHLFDNYEVHELAMSRAPVPVLWAVSSSGRLLGCTYIGEEQVAAWHQHTTDGTVESVCVAVEGLEDILYMVVNRTINGTTKRYIERLSTVNFDSPAEAWFVDSGLQYYLPGTYTRSGTTLTVTTTSAHGLTTGNSRTLRFSDAALNGSYSVTVTSTTAFTITTASGSGSGTVEVCASTLTGLSHLEGKTVAILADGVPQTAATVSAGAVTIASPAARVTVGLPYTSDIKTLPLAMQIDGMGQGRTKNVGRAWVKVVDTGALEFGPDEGRLVEFNATGQLSTSELQVTGLPGWTQSGQVILRCSDPTPAEATGLTLEVAIGS